MTTISITALQTLCEDALQNAGLRKQDIIDTTAHLLENELSGKSSHGIVRVVEAIKAIRKYGVPTKDPEIETDNGNMVTLNANRQIGVVAAKAAMDIAMQRAKTHGIALVGVRDYIATSGALTYYLRRFAQADLIAFMGCNSVAMVAPPDGKTRKIGTNPIGIAIPGEEHDFIADLGTAAMAYGKMMVMKEQGKPVPEGMLIDKEGQPSTNADDAYNGAILPLAGYKGFALGLMIELLAGPLIGAKAIKSDLYDNDGLFMIVIDPKNMAQENFKALVSAALEEIKSAPTCTQDHEITLPGQRSYATLEANKKKGEINIADKILNDLSALAAQERKE